jgi:hypothetical protein
MEKKPKISVTKEEKVELELLFRLLEEKGAILTIRQKQKFSTLFKRIKKKITLGTMKEEEIGKSMLEFCEKIYFVNNFK